MESAVLFAGVGAGRAIVIEAVKSVARVALSFIAAIFS